MSDQQRRAFLLAGTRTGHLATVRDDGRPHVAPIWFTLDGDDVIFMTGADTVKGRNLRRTGEAALSVDEPTPDYAFVHIGGTAELSDDLDEMHRWALPISERYMGADRAEEFARRNAVEGELLVRLRPATTVAVAGVAD
jgi:hypothetical protein